MRKWAADLARSRAVDSHARAAPAKAALRRWLLEAIGADYAHVLDLFAGAGGMYRAAWHLAASYRGCDKRFFGDRRPAYVVDNLRLLRALDLERFNVFDLDAYGAPWDAATILAARRALAEGETVGLALTDGAMMKARLGGVAHSMAFLAGVSPTLPGAYRDWERLTRAALAEMARRMGGDLVDMRAADQSARCMYYCAALFRHRSSTGTRNPGEKKGNYTLDSLKHLMLFGFLALGLLKSSASFLRWQFWKLAIQ